ncbi:MAG: AAA family ATPase [Anaerolineae bacterium]|nr:AAA family ATPase [Anaerolineae bacterium]
MSLDPTLETRLIRYLPRDLLNELPDPQALTKAIRRLNSLHQALASFLPQYIADNEQHYTQDYGALRPGTFMFADVSGFTALSEKLQREGGREGAEILTQIINEFFATMLEILAKSNGQLLKFAGDALLTFFPASPLDDEVPLAIRTGLRMQRAMRRDFQPIRHPLLAELFGDHNLELTMSIGICQGKLFEAVVGSHIQRDHMIQGDLPGQAMRAEEAGERDDVIITAGLQEAYQTQFDTVPAGNEPDGDGFFRVIDSFGDDLDDYEFVVPRRRRGQSSAIFALTEEYLLDDLQQQLERVDGVARFVAKEVVDKLAFRGDHIESENRPATVIFLHFTGFADLVERWGEDRLPLITSILDRYYTIMQRTIAANGGSLTRSDPYRRGVKLLITFGAPVAHPDDPQRAVMTALEMNRQLAALNTRLRDEVDQALVQLLGDNTFITQCAGITHGPVFAGEVGWRARREYTVMGDDVNLAARLMSKGDPGQILISARVWERVNTDFETGALPPMQLKNKRDPVQSYSVTASTASALDMSVTSDTPFAGHDLHMLTLTYGLQQAKGPRRRQVFAIQGDTGAGKTRIAKQVAADAEQTGFSAAWANCSGRTQRGRDQNVWAALIFQLLQLDRAKSEQARHRLLHVRLDELGLPDLEGMFSTLLFGASPPADAFDPAELPGSPAVDTPPPAARRPTNIYEIAQTKTDIRQSSIFAAINRQLESDDAPESEPVAEMGTETDNRPLWQAVRRRISLPAGVVRFLQALTEEAPVLLVIDDVHRADPTTLAILKQVVADITKARLVILLTYEPDETDLDLGKLRRVAIGDLDRDETALLSARMLGVSRLGSRLHTLVWERTGGRPLFIESLLRVLQADDAIELTGGQAELKPDVTPDTLPDNVRELILSQIDRLTPEARAVLRAASVAGDGFSVAELLAVDEDLGDETQLEVLLGELIQARVITMRTGGTYHFQHGLTQATVYESLNRLQRLKLHRAAAAFWERQDTSDRAVLRMSYHFIKGGMPMRGIELVFGAADKAEQSGQIDRAIELYTHALDILPHDESIRVRLERLQQMQ